MKFIASLALALCLSTSAFSATRQLTETRTGGWLASAGVGLWIDPSLFLLSPQLEYKYRHNLYFGPLVQLGLGSGTLFTATATARLIIGHSRIKPSVEAGLGMAFASGGAVGLHVPIGIGVDYQLEPGIALGTLIRGNLMFGSKFGQTFSVSWPLLIGRFAI